MTAQAPNIRATASAGSWPGRPPGLPGDVPPPPLPLSFLAAAAVGLIATGGALLWARAAAAADPTADPVVAAAHFGMLATLSMGVLGALHQFAPVVSQRPLRSIRLGWATFLTWLGASWLLPLGIAAEREAVVEAGGALAAVTIALLVVNLWRPLAARGKGVPVMGLRLAIAGFAATACFGVVYVADRRGGWFALEGHVVAAHAVIGLFAWLGLVYLSVAEKLWPMFFLAHIPGRRRAPWIGVVAAPAGVALASPGLLLGLSWLAWAGGALLAVGMGAHVVSLAAHLSHRRRKADLHLVFVTTSAAWLLAGAGLAFAAALTMGGHHRLGMALAAAAVTAFAGWLLEALIGHAHKVAPFIMWSVLRARGIATVSGRPLGFADLYDHRLAAAVYGLVTAGVASVCAGFGASSAAAVAVGGALLMAAGFAVAANLSLTPALMLRRQRRSQEKQPAATSPSPAGASPADRPTGASAVSAASSPPAGAGRHLLPTILPWAAIAAAGVAVLMAASALWPGPGSAGQGSTAGAGARVAPTGQVKTFTIELGDMFVRPSSITVPYGARVVLHVVNHGSMTHDLQREGGSPGTGLLAPGRRTTADFGVFGHTEQAWCTLPGHKEAGMILTIKVAGLGRSSAGASSGAPAGMPGAMAAAAPGAAAPDASIDFSAQPGPGWQPFNPLLSAAPGGTTHRVTLIAEDRVVQVAPGVSQEEWTFNGRAPGPTLRGRVGDLFIVTLVNHSRMGHSLDFHAASQPMQAMRTIGPGQSMTERFRANYAGIFLYHCGTAPVLEHLANGMFGAMIIDPPHLAPVGREFLVVQSELYLGPQRQPGDYRKMLSGQPDAVVFNGYADQYLHSPLQVRAGERVRIWVLDAGPSEDSAFHVVGAQFDTVYNDGAYLLRRGNADHGAAQTLDLMPGEGGFVEFTVPAGGMYELVDHHFDHAAQGAAGYLMASRR